MKAKRRTIFLGILCLSLFLLCFSSLTAFAEHSRDARTKGDRTSDRTSDRRSHTESGTEQTSGLEKTKSVSESPASKVAGPETNEKKKNSTESSTKRNSQATMPQAPEGPEDSKSRAPAEPQAPPTAKLSNPSGPGAPKVDAPKA